MSPAWIIPSCNDWGFHSFCDYLVSVPSKEQLPFYTIPQNHWGNHTGHPKRKILIYIKTCDMYMFTFSSLF